MRERETNRERETVGQTVMLEKQEREIVSKRWGVKWRDGMRDRLRG